MNLYEILDIPYDSSKEIIKHAYKKQSLKYHPDKNINIDASDKFREVQMAYEILYDDGKRKKYDNMSNSDRMSFYDMIKQYFTELRPEYSSVYDIIVKNIYGDDENKLKNDLNSFNFRNMFDKFNDKIQYDMNNKKTDSDITINLSINLKDVMTKQYKRITVHRRDDTSNQYIIPLSKKYLLLKGEGEHSKLNKNGDLHMNIEHINNTDYVVINDYDLFITKKISLYQYLYGGKIEIKYIDESYFDFNFDSCLEKKPIFTIKNKGLPKPFSPFILSRDFFSIDLLNNMIYGDLIIYLTIDGINSIDTTDLSLEYIKSTKELISSLFPPLP